MIYGSVCSGIEAATVAWHPLGWKPAFFSEIEKFPSVVIAHHYPNVPNLGDMTKHGDWNHEPIDLLVGGTPCQSFSVAGLRKGMADPRGNLALVFLGIVDRARPRWVVWENVPGVLSSNGGRDFGSFLGGLAELGYGWAYRVLDAQYFGVPQRRRRVFVVGYLGDWRRPAAVLFERQSLQGRTPPRREAGSRVTPSVTSGPPKSRDYKDATDLICMATGQGSAEVVRDGSPSLTCNHEAPIITHTLTKRMDSSEDGTGRGTPIIAVQDGRGMAKALNGKGWDDSGTAYTLDRVSQQAVAFTCINDGRDVISGITPTLGCGGGGGYGAGMAVATMFKVRCGCEGGGKGYLGSDDKSFTISTGQDQTLHHGMSVRRLTPRECERLQGFPDDYTLVPFRGKPAADGPRYKAIGNSMAVPVMSWIGERIQAVDDLEA